MKSEITTKKQLHELFCKNAWKPIPQYADGEFIGWTMAIIDEELDEFNVFIDTEMSVRFDTSGCEWIQLDLDDLNKITKIINKLKIP